MMSAGPGDGSPLSISTIYALSTSPGRAAIAVVRISGPLCKDIYRKLCPNAPLPRPRYAAARTLYDPIAGPTSATVLDDPVLVLFFPGPRSATGEDVLELHIHGGPAVIRAVLNAIPRCRPPPSPIAKASPALPPRHAAIRPAEPGEFTRRAFYSGRLDLPEAEALGETLSAETEQQRLVAQRSAGAALSETYEGWRRSLVAARGELEALIDFAEDQHFDESPALLTGNVAWQVLSLQSEMRAHVENAVRGEMRRGGIKVALLGAPNAGKSSLLNRVVGREAAIVSREAGTTRDLVEVSVDVNGWLVLLGDMAGLRGSVADSKSSPSALAAKENADENPVGDVEAEGISRARARAMASDVVVVVLSIEPETSSDPLIPPCRLHLDPAVLSAARDASSAGATILATINKADLIPAASSSTTTPHLRRLAASALAIPESRVCLTSCYAAATPTTVPTTANYSAGTSTPDPGGIQAFLCTLSSTFAQITGPVDSPHTPLNAPPAHAPAQPRPDPRAALATTHRQRLLLDECLSHLDAFLGQAGLVAGNPSTPSTASEDPDVAGAGDALDVVLAAESLRAAAECLARVTGRGGGAGDVEEVLGVVFERFCVGK